MGDLELRKVVSQEKETAVSRWLTTHNASRIVYGVVLLMISAAGAQLQEQDRMYCPRPYCPENSQRCPFQL